MRRTEGAQLGMVVVAAVLFGSAVTARAQDLVAPTDARTPAEERRAFKLPPGFEAQLIASEPDIHKPMNIAFDAKGRLWVTDTIEYPYPAPAGKTPRDSVKILEDFGEDGRARKVTTFADGFNIPIGLLPLPDAKSALVYGIDKIYRVTDADGDGKADKREVVLGTYGFKDTHGMTNSFTVGYDGWVYACHGFSNDSVVRAKDGSEIRMNSGNVYRFKPDGSRVEYVSHGQVNPFGLCFDPWGNLYSADCHSRPQYLLLRGAYYPSFGKPDDGLGFGPEMIFHDHGSTGIAGTLFYDADHFPAAYRGTMFNGNPVTGRINHDKLDWRGSSPRAVEQPDFMTSDDPWFRPVDIKLGPDGAMYVADFYNKIIGHYEVRLDHPGRDRERGRIWRIVYKGNEAGARPLRRIPDITQVGAEDLVGAFSHPNLSFRMAAADRLVGGYDRATVAAAATKGFDAAKTPTQVLHSMWALHRVGALKDELIGAASEHPDAVVRVHAMRVLSETPVKSWTPPRRELALRGLKDKDAMVRRGAADALAQHPAAEHVRPLLDALNAAARDDTHLRHALRIALRNQLQPEGNLAKLPLDRWSDADRSAVADVALGVQSPEVAGFIVEHVEKYVTQDRQQAARFLRHAARFLPDARVDALAKLATGKFGDDVDFQLALYRSVQEGLAQRGIAPAAGLRQWGAQLAERLMAAATPDADTWVRRPLPGREASRSPWFIQSRPSGDGNVGAPFWSSLPPGGEQLTGVIRSEPFVAPEKLSVYLAGHNGPPGEDGIRGNFVRVLDAQSGEVLAHAVPPRADVARRISLDLGKGKGRRVVFEATDGNDGDGYAWLAFGRFDPPAVKLPAVGPDVIRDRQQGAAEIAEALKLTALERRLADVVASTAADAQARAAAARALAAISPDAHVKSLGAIAADPEVPPALREGVAQALGELNSDAGRAELVTALSAAPRQLQRALALALAGRAAGAAALLKAVEEGKASARLLQEPAVREKLKASGAADVNDRVERLTRNLPAASEELERVVQKQRAAFDPAKASANRGGAVFATHCAVCHSIKGEGGNIGPQLGGLGKRGVERVIEDVLDPNRNVDAAFRMTILRLKGGDTVAGLLRREEGEVIVIADSAGKELSVPKASVERRGLSPLSPMPANFHELIPPQDINDLVEFLIAN